jgi:hypothetical protein
MLMETLYGLMTMMAENLKSSLTLREAFASSFVTLALMAQVLG